MEKKLSIDIRSDFDSLDSSIRLMPTDEIKYHFFTLFKLLKKEANENPGNPKLASVLRAADRFAHTVLFLLKKEEKQLSKKEIRRIKHLRLEECIEDFSKLIEATETSYFKSKTIHAITVASGMILGVVTAALGATIGFIRGFFNKRPIRGALGGLVMGAAIGGAIGYRTPKKLIKDPFDRKLKIVSDRMTRSIGELNFSICHQNRTSFLTHKRKVEEVIRQYYKNDEKKFNEFLERKFQFTIATHYVAKDTQSEGYLGHHAFIRIDHPIDNESKSIDVTPINNLTLDLGRASQNTKYYRQEEARTATGRTLIHMIAMNNLLNQKYFSKLGLFHYKVGEQDCHTFINTLLVSTNQLPMKTITRFSPNDKWSAKNLLCPLLKWLSPFGAGYCSEQRKPLETLNHLSTHKMRNK
jgi:hypothetical protein